MNPFAYVAILVVLLWMVGTRSLRMAKALALPRCLSMMVIAASSLYISGLIPGILGCLAPLPFLICLVCVTGVLAGIFRKVHASVQDKPVHLETGGQLERPGAWRAEDVLLATVGLLGCGPLLYEAGYAAFYALLFPAEAKVGIDVAYCHVPCMVRFIQQGTFWDLRNGLQGYSYAYEIIGNAFSFACHKTWGLWLGHWLGLGLTVAALAQVTRKVLWAWQPARPPRLAPVVLMVAGLWSVAFSHAIRQVGKNDIFLNASALAALALLLEWAESVPLASASPLRQRLLLCLAAVAAGLSFGTKPTAACYILFFAGAVVLIRLSASPNAFRNNILPALADGFLVGAIAVVLGGFFLLRNLAMVGSLSAIPNAYRDVLAPHLLKGFVYRLRPVSLAIVFGAVVVSVGAVLSRFWGRSHGPRAVLALFGGFALASTATFVLSPFVIQNNYYNVRYAICMLACTMVVAAIMSAHLSAVFFRLNPVIQAFGALVAGLCIVLWVAFHWNRTTVAGLPGWNVTGFGSPTGIYAWADSLANPCRFLVVGSFYPSGFQGKDWRHDVVAPPLVRSAPEAARSGPVTNTVAADIAAYRPNVVVVGTQGEQAEVIRWLEAHPDWFEAVYQDDAARAFRVRQEAFQRARSP